MLQVERLDKLIVDSPLSINEIAGLAEITPEYIWTLRKGKAPNVSAVVLARVAEVFGVSLDYLMGIERDGHGVPVPALEARVLVARLNSLAQAQRAQLCDGFMQVLDAFVTEAEVSEEEQQFVRLWQALPVEIRERMGTQIQAEAAALESSETRAAKNAGAQAAVA